MSQERRCEGPDCSEPVHAFGLCQGHAKQRQRRRALTPLREKTSLRERVQEAALALADAVSDEDYDRALARLRRAQADAFLAAGWRPPARPRQLDKPNGVQNPPEDVQE